MTTSTGNFGHIRESGVYLQSEEDASMKTKRNCILAGSVITSIFTLGISSAWTIVESCREDHIRDLNRKYFPELPYAKCVMLEKDGKVEYKGKVYEDPIAKEEKINRQKKEDNDRKLSPSEWKHKRQEELYVYNGDTSTGTYEGSLYDGDTTTYY